MEDVTAQSGECVEAKALLTCNSPTEGFVTAVKHDPAAVTLDSITIRGTVTETNQADFTVFEVLSNGGTAAVIMDLEAPFLGNTIPQGENLAVAIYKYCCQILPSGSAPVVTPLRLVDGELGSPPKENVVVIGGRGYAPTLCDGSVTCKPVEPTNGPCFLAGGGKLDAQNQPVALRAAPGETVELSFYYTSPEDNVPGPVQLDQIQGLSMALCYECHLQVIASSFQVPPDSITSAIQAEYVSFAADNDSGDGDGCEMILAILVDAESPYDRKTLPPTETPLKLASVGMKVMEDSLCGNCLPVQFCDGVNGAGRVPIQNLYAAENRSYKPCLVNTEVCISGNPIFQRGDCNNDRRVNISDAVVTLMFLFPEWSSKYSPVCFDACDSNDDGRIDLADASASLAWLFVKGTDDLPPPGPIMPGLDPTDDTLTCSSVPCE